MKTAVLGASGYAGAEILRLAAGHPELEVVLAGAESTVGTPIATYVPGLAGAYPLQIFDRNDQVFHSDAEIVFLALPHGVSQSFVPRLVDQGRMVVDLGADFRLRDAAEYATWYGHPHEAPELLSSAVYALVERHRHEIVGARLVAVPGCYPTATALALGPFVDAGWLRPSGHVVNALSGTSGAGRATSDRLHFSRLAGNAEAYGLLHHRHTAEMQAELGVELLFTPHLVPVARGMLVTAYGHLEEPHTSDDALDLLRETYSAERFVVVTDEPPGLKDAVGSNLTFVSARVDPRTGWLLAMSSIDNLGKGAASQAIQACNVALGWPEELGLAACAVTP
jgi:N-acetyl-gamma-glutamyl-phosphate reductase